MRAIPKSALQKKVRDLTEEESAELKLATGEALGRLEPPPKWQHLYPGGEEKGSACFPTPFPHRFPTCNFLSPKGAMMQHQGAVELAPKGRDNKA